MPNNQFLLIPDTAKAVTEAGVPLKKRGARTWAAKYPELTVKIAGRRAFRTEAIDLILSGMPIDEVATLMRARYQTRRNAVA